MINKLISDLNLSIILIDCVMSISELDIKNTLFDNWKIDIVHNIFKDFSSVSSIPPKKLDSQKQLVLGGHLDLALHRII